MTTAYPLAWPEGWPRTPAAQRVNGQYNFKKTGNDGWKRSYTFAEARDALIGEVRKMGAAGFVLSTNYQISSVTGLPRSDRRAPEDTGVAIYFTRKGKPLAMACDRYTRAEENMNSLRLALDAMRQLERHGGGLMAEKAFTGFAALPAPKSCWEILGLAGPAVTAADVQSAWREKVRAAHPDQGGSQATAAHADPCNAPLPHQGETFTGRVAYVGDGDSLCVTGAGGLIEIRVADFYAVELHEPGGQDAKARASRALMDRTLVCRADHRSYDRIVAWCSLNGTPLGQVLRAAGVREGGRGR